MKKALLSSAAFLILLAAAFPSLRARWMWERTPAGKTVTLCLDGNELGALYPRELPSDVLRRFDALGVRSVSVPYDGAAAGALPWGSLLPASMAATARPVFKKLSEGGRSFRKEELLSSAAPARFFLPAGIALPPPGPDSPLERTLASTDGLFPWMEFSRSAALESIARDFPERLVRGHSIDEDEILRLSPAAAVARFRRAVRERGARFLYVRLFPGLTPEANESYVGSLAEGLKADGFSLGLCVPRLASAPPGGPSTAARQGAALFLAVLAPWLLFSLWKDVRPWWTMPFLATALSIALALLVAALLSSPDFLSGLAVFRGVKAALALPLLLTAAELYSKTEIRSFFRRPLTVGGAALLAFVSLAGVVYLLRSGHDTPVGASGLELRLRGLLEDFFGVRPRFKEFLLGHPLLWLGAYLSSRGKDARALLLAGMIGQLSVINIFCHAHIPLAVSLLRAFHGFWIGSLFGLVLILLHRSFGPRPIGKKEPSSR